MLFFYIRHGQPIYEPNALTPLGRRQAEAVARRLAQFGVDRVFASPSTRAMETARPLCDILRLEPTTLDWCDEAVAWEAMKVPRAEGGYRWPFANPEFVRRLSDPALVPYGMEWYRHPMFADVPAFARGVESMRDHVDAFFDALGYRHDRATRRYAPIAPTNERVALFAHEGVANLFFSAMLDIPYPVWATRFCLSHTGMTVVEFNEAVQGKADAPRTDFVIPRVLQVSNDSHLYRDALPLRYQDRLSF